MDNRRSLLLVVAISGCPSPSRQFMPATGADQLEYRADAAVVYQGQPHIDVRATAVNRTGSTVRLTIPKCAVTLSLYPATGDPKIFWNSRLQRSPAFPDSVERICSGGTLELDLAPGDSISGGPLRHTVSLHEIGGGGFDRGEYLAEVAINISGVSRKLNAGRISIDPQQVAASQALRRVSPLDSSLRDVKFDIRSGIEGVAPASLAVRLTAHNRGSVTAHFWYGACALTVFGYRSAARTGKPAWRSDDTQPPGRRSRFTRVCPMYLATTNVPPGDSLSPREFNLLRPTHEILGDSLPEGAYFLRAELEVNNRTIEFDAGRLQITRRQAPIPSSRNLKGMIYSASIRRLPSPVKRTRLLELKLVIRNRSRTTITIPAENRAECVTFIGYNSRRDRDFRYMNAANSWGAGGCALFLPELVLRPGEVRTLRAHVDVPPSHTHYAVLLPVVVDGKGQRHSPYHFTLRTARH